MSQSEVPSRSPFHLYPNNNQNEPHYTPDRDRNGVPKRLRCATGLPNRLHNNIQRHKYKDQHADLAYRLAP